jgi:pimeloyl-ACP methyl ester carboxylesterase
LAAGGAAGVVPARASADLDWKPCGSSGFACGHLTVPLSRSGAVPGTVTLAIRRRRAPVGDESVAVFALAGGPGQPALPLTDGLQSLLGSVLSSRDLIVFDQRGTGLSGALHCPAFVHRNIGQTPPGALVASCASQLGAGRGDYTTEDSVQDIEAIRQATGYRKIVLYGTSYGTKVALDYAREYPDHVDSLLLDSVVTQDGPDLFSRSTFAAVDRVLGQLCGGRRCAHITSSAAGDLARLAARLRRRPIHGRVVDGHGHGHRVPVSEHDLLDILVSGDLDPTLRSDFPAAVRAALRGDDAALARLRQRALVSEAGGGIDNPLFYSTYCEEVAFPWNRAATPAVRLAQVQAAADALPTNAFAPFDRGVALFESGAQQCDGWPYSTPAPAIGGPPLPNVPTLILSGADDLRTPTADARAVAAQIPDAKLVVVPDTGHSVLGSDFGSCAETAVQAFFAGKPVQPCRPQGTPALLRPTAIPPLHLASVRPSGHLGGRAGETVTAIALTLDDLTRQLLDKVSNASSASQLARVDVGGLRAGWAEFTLSRLGLHGLSYVPGVTLSGALVGGRLVLHIGGRSAAHGVLSAPAGGRFRGTLDGHSVSVRLPVTPSPTASIARAASAPAVARGPRLP